MIIGTHDDSQEAGITGSYLQDLVRGAHEYLMTRGIFGFTRDNGSPFFADYGYYKGFWSSFNCHATFIHSIDSFIWAESQTLIFPGRLLSLKVLL